MCPALPTPEVPCTACSGFACNQGIKVLRSSAGKEFCQPQLSRATHLAKIQREEQRSLSRPEMCSSASPRSPRGCGTDVNGEQTLLKKNASRRSGAIPRAFRERFLMTPERAREVLQRANLGPEPRKHLSAQQIGECRKHMSTDEIENIFEIR